MNDFMIHNHLNSQVRCRPKPILDILISNGNEFPET